MSKGDKPRLVDKEKYDKNFIAIFGEKKLNIMSDKDREEIEEWECDYCNFPINKTDYQKCDRCKLYLCTDCMKLHACNDYKDVNV